MIAHVMFAIALFAAELFVSPGGNVPSPQAAVQEVRNARKTGRIGRSERVVIRLAAGVYRVDAPIVLTPEDSHISFIGSRDGGRSVISGGRPLPLFDVGADGIWRVRVPKGVAFEQLWVDGSWRDRARTPNAGFFYMDHPAEERAARSTFFAEPDDLDHLLRVPSSSLTNAIVQSWHSWFAARRRIRSIDIKTGCIVTEPQNRWNYFYWRPYRPRYRLENYIEALDAPGEWFLDGKSGELLYLPLPGEDCRTTRAVVPTTDMLVDIRGDRLAGRLVEGVTFEDVDFENCGYFLPAGGQSDSQAAENEPAAIRVNGGEGIGFRRIGVAHVSSYGVWFERGCQNCSVENSIFSHLGGGGVKIGSNRRWQESELPDKLTSFVKVDGCRILHGGRLFPEAVGLWIGFAHDCELTNNEISDLNYSGISVGWTWGYHRSVARNNLIAYNRIHDIGHGVLSDMGGIYTLGPSEGTRVIGNEISDVWSYDYTVACGNGLYADEGSSGILFESNKVWNVKTYCAMMNYGSNCTYRGNVFYTNGTKAAFHVCREEKHVQMALEGNRILADRPPTEPLCPEIVPPPMLQCPRWQADFEDPGKLTALSYDTRLQLQCGSGKGESIRIDSNRAKSGTHSLAFTETAGLEAPYLPHAFFRHRSNAPIVRLSFSANVDVGAAVEGEFRYYGVLGSGKYSCGPGFSFRNGVCKVAGRLVPGVASGEWVGFDFKLYFEGPKARTFDVMVSSSKGVLARHEGLPLANAGFEAFEWFGFMTYSELGKTWYLDDFRYEELTVSGDPVAVAREPSAVPELRKFRAPAKNVKAHKRGFLLVEAENFADYGSWQLDTQFTHRMGSAYLIVPGVFRPVKNARTTVDIPESGSWRVWVRDKDWLPEFSPGKFALEIEGVRTKALGVSGKEGWRWEDAGVFRLDAGPRELALVDLSGAFARVDAILLTRDVDYVPPDDSRALTAVRTELSGLPAVADDGGEFDVVVVGAGPAGTTAALAAARQGARTLVVHDRPAPGGNAASEYFVPVNGAGCYHPGWREAGIVDEMGLTALAHDRLGLSEPYRCAISATPSLREIPNTRVISAETRNGRIVSVLGRGTLDGRETRFRGKIFVDGTGDGWLGYFAGAKYMYGREGRAQFGESLAPERADTLTMSGCLMGEYGLGYQLKWTGAPSPFTAPPWAARLPEGFVRNPPNPQSQWWVEHGGDVDDLADPEHARDSLIRINLAYWDWVKNVWKGKDAAANLRLDFLPHGNARREGRRLVGDYVFTEADAKAGRDFPDKIGAGGWPLDTHDPQGIFNPRGSGSWRPPNGASQDCPPYSIPYRILFSTNVPNLFMCGRCASASHVGMGSLRVEGTCAVMGQAAGTAAARCAQLGLLPREYGRLRITELQRLLQKDGQYIPWMTNSDPKDLARRARVSATSSATVAYPRATSFDPAEGWSHELTCWRAVWLAAPGCGFIEKVRLHLISERTDAVGLEVFLVETDAETIESGWKPLASGQATVAAGSKGWVDFPVSAKVSRKNVWIVVKPQKGIRWSQVHGSEDTVFTSRAISGHRDGSWRKVAGEKYAFALEPAWAWRTDVRPENVVDGVQRTTDDGCSHGWFSDPLKSFPQSVTLEFPALEQISEVHLYLDSDFTRKRLLFEGLRRFEHSLPSTLVKDYVLELSADGRRWEKVEVVSGNFLSHRVHRFRPRNAKFLRVTVFSTHGDRAARIFEIRAYK